MSTKKVILVCSAIVILLLVLVNCAGCRVSEQTKLNKETAAPTLAKQIVIDTEAVRGQVEQAKSEVEAITVALPPDEFHKAAAIVILGDASANLAGIGDKANILIDKTKSDAKKIEAMESASARKWQLWGWCLIAGGIAGIIGSFWLGSIFRWAGGIALGVGLAFKVIGDHYGFINKTIDITIAVVALAFAAFLAIAVWQLIYFKRKGLTWKAALAQVILNVKELDANPTDDEVKQ